MDFLDLKSIKSIIHGFRGFDILIYMDLDWIWIMISIHLVPLCVALELIFLENEFSYSSNTFPI